MEATRFSYGELDYFFLISLIFKNIFVVFLLLI